MEFLAANLQILYAIAGVLIAIAAASLVYTNFSQKRSVEIDELARNFEIQANAGRSLLRELEQLDPERLPAATESIASLVQKLRRQADDLSSIEDRVATLARQPDTSRDDLRALLERITLSDRKITSEQLMSLSNILARSARLWQRPSPMR